MVTIDSKQALSRLQALCSRSEKCISDIKNKLAQWGINADDMEPIISELLRDKYVDEQRYARAYANDKMLISGWGILKIRMALRAKGIPDDIIKDTINGIDMHAYFSILIKELKKKARAIKYKSPSDLKNKLLRFAMSRGYEYPSVTPYITSVVVAMFDDEFDY